MDKPPAHEQCSCLFLVFQVLFDLMKLFKVKCSLGLETLKGLQCYFSLEYIEKLKNITYNPSKFILQ